MNAAVVISAPHATLVSESFARVHPRASAFTVAFFSRLHAEVPRFRVVFPSKDAAKRALAKEVFDLVVASLHSGDELRQLLERMGRRGLLDGSSEREITAIGSCLLATLADFDVQWSDEIAYAWASIYRWAADAVRRGAVARRSIIASRR